MILPPPSPLSQYSNPLASLGVKLLEQNINRKKCKHNFRSHEVLKNRALVSGGEKIGS